MHTSVGYCVYDPSTEQFDRKPEVWLKTINVEGAPQRLLVDTQKNIMSLRIICHNVVGIISTYKLNSQFT